MIHLTLPQTDRTEAERFAKLTSHLRVNSKPLASLALALEAERQKDPLRALITEAAA